MPNSKCFCRWLQFNTNPSCMNSFLCLNNYLSIYNWLTDKNSSAWSSWQKLFLCLWGALFRITSTSASTVTTQLQFKRCSLILTTSKTLKLRSWMANWSRPNSCWHNPCSFWYPLCRMISLIWWRINLNRPMSLPEGAIQVTTKISSSTMLIQLKTKMTPSFTSV